ncbi:hypothetical protein D3C72_1655080 [compost metagenome]
MPRTPRNPTPPHLRQISAAVGRCRPWSTHLSDFEIHLGSDPFRQIAGICRRRGGSGCGGVSAMDGAPKPPWVRALCLRSTASQAPERTAASGWAGLGIHGVPRNRTHPAIPRNAAFCRCRCSGLCGCRAQPCRTPPPTFCLRTTDIVLMVHGPRCSSVFTARMHGGLATAAAVPVADRQRPGGWRPGGLGRTGPVPPPARA